MFLAQQHGYFNVEQLTTVNRCPCGSDGKTWKVEQLAPLYEELGLRRTLK